MNNLYKEMVRKPGDLCFEVSLESDKGLTTTDLSFALKFFVYGHPKNVCIHKDDLKVVEGKYYAVLNEHGFVNGVLFCEAEIVETINGINRIVSVRSNTGYMIGNCCQPSVDTSSCAHGYSLSLYKVEYVPQPIDPNPEEDQLVAEELFGEKLSLPELTADRAIADEHGNRIADTYETRQAVRNHIREVYNEQFIENPPLILDEYITPGMLSEGVKDMLAQAGATINNVPDGEDLTTKQGVLKLSDKPYNPGAYSGLGRVYLRKNLVGGQNLLTQTMVSKPNTIYILQYDYTLDGKSITIPEGCVLQFEGGSLRTGTIIGTNTAIKSDIVKIFGLDIDTSGTWNVAEVYPEWFGAIGDNSCDDYEPITKCMYSVLSHKIRLSKLYRISKGLLYQHDIDKDNKYNRSLSFVGNSKEDTGFYLYNESEIKPVIQIFGNGASFENLLIKGAKVSEDWSDYNKRIEAHGIDLRNCKYPTYVNNCKIINCSSCGIMAIGTSGGRFTNNIIYNVYGEAILNSIQGWSTVIANNILGSSNSPRMKWGIDSNVKNTEIRSNVIYNVEVGITFENMNHNEQDTSYDNNTFNGIIEGNIIYNSSFCGINISTANHVYLVRNVLVTNNLILPDYNLEVYGEGLGIAFGNVEHVVISNNKITATRIQQEYVYPNTCIGVKVGSISKDILIENNVFSGFQRFGISLYDQNYSYDDRDEIKNITIKNNIFNNIKAAAIQTRDKCSNVFIANNMSYETNTIQIVGEIKGFAHFQGNIAIGDGVTALHNVLNTDYKQHETIFDVKNEEELPLDVNKSRIITAYTQNGINHYYNNAWRRFDGYPISLKTIGTWDERPDTSLIKKGYLYYDTTSYRLMIYRGLNANDWICVDDGRKTHAFALSDNDNQRPELQYGHRGLSVFDSNINKPIWWTGYTWVDATGTEV